MPYTEANIYYTEDWPLSDVNQEGIKILNMTRKI